MTVSMMEMIDLTALGDKWVVFLSNGMEALDDSLSSMPASPSKSCKNVHFRNPLVTSCHYRPRDTPEEIRKLFFTKEEMALMRLERRARILEEKEECYEQGNAKAIMTKPPTRQCTPKFEVIAKGQTQVKVVYAVPRRKRRHASSGAS